MRSLSVLISIISFTFLHAQEESITIDLSEFDGRSTTIQKPLRANKVKSIVILNKLTNVDYNISIDIEPAMLPALSLAGAGAAPSPCANLAALYKTAMDIAVSTAATANEKKLKEALDQLQDEMKKNPCTSDAGLLTNISTLMDKTKQTITTNVTLNPREDLVVTIKRGNDKVYKLILKSKQNSRWVLNYGFAFTSKRLEPRKYFMEEVGQDSFRISQRAKYGLTDMRFIPSVFFSYFLDKNLDKAFNHSITGGLGFNTQTPVVFIGYNAMWNQNVGLSMGFSFYEQDKLLGKYKTGQILKESLDDNQLYEKTIFRPNFFIAINLRLADNPFKSSSQGKE